MWSVTGITTNAQPVSTGYLFVEGVPSAFPGGGTELAFGSLAIDAVLAGVVVALAAAASAYVVRNDVPE